MRPMPFLAAACLLFSATHAQADGVFHKLVTRNDASKLERYDATRDVALRSVEKNASASDYAAAKKLLNIQPLSFRGFDLTGDWKCRTTKLGGNPAYVRYAWFQCNVSDDGSGWALTKRTGSQRTMGRFYTASDTALHYIGSFYIAGDSALPYGKNIDSDQVGLAERTGAQSWRISFPEPRFESKFDVLEFRR